MENPYVLLICDVCGWAFEFDKAWHATLGREYDMGQYPIRIITSGKVTVEVARGGGWDTITCQCPEVPSHLPILLEREGETRGDVRAVNEGVS